MILYGKRNLVSANLRLFSIQNLGSCLGLKIPERRVMVAKNISTIHYGSPQLIGKSSAVSQIECLSVLLFQFSMGGKLAHVDLRYPGTSICDAIQVLAINRCLLEKNLLSSSTPNSLLPKLGSIS